MKTFLADGFRNVDSVSDAKKILRCLSFMDDLPDFRAYKELSIDTGPDGELRENGILGL